MNKSYFITEDGFMKSSLTKDQIIKLDVEPNFAHLFFVNNEKHFLIASTKDNKYAIVNCELGHCEEKEKEDDWIWEKIWQVDNETILIRGRYPQQHHSVYKFYNYSKYSLQKLETAKNVPLSKYLLNHYLVDGVNQYPDPEIDKNGLIKFRVYKNVVHGLCLRNKDNELEEITMEIEEYKNQMNLPEGFNLPYYKHKIFPLEVSRSIFQRRGNQIILCMFWTNEQDLEHKLGGELIPQNEMNNSSCSMLQKLLDELQQDKDFDINICEYNVENTIHYAVYVYPVQIWQLIRCYYTVEFQIDSPIYHLFTNNIRYTTKKKLIESEDELEINSFIL